MTTNVLKQDSNQTGLHFCEETTLGTLPATASQIWYPLEPNSYTDFGGQIKVTARNPILASRQRKKGVTTDLDASGGLVQDLTQTNLTRLLQGFMFADFREKYDSRSFGNSPVVDISVDGTDNGFESAAFGISTNVLVRSLLLSSGWVNGTNNGLKEVSAITADTDVDVTDTALVNEVYNANARIEVVGYRFVVATADIVNSGSAFPYLSRASGAVDWRTLGLIPGEWVWLGGDATANHYVTAANNTWARVYSIAADRITFDKTGATLVSEVSTSLQIDMYFGKVVKNEADPTLQVRRSYTLQRKMGAEDSGSPTNIQSEYIKGAVAKTLKLNMGTASLITADLSFTAIDNYARTGAQGPLSTQATATEIAADNTDAFNTTSHFGRLKMAIISLTNGAPTALFAYVTDLSITIENNLSPAKAVSVLGAFDVIAGQFQVSGTATAYFTDTAAVAAVRANADVSIDFALVRQTPALHNAGMVVDMPLLALGDARAKVELNKPILLPLTMDAAPDRVFDHTLLMTVFDYLPDLA
jgi:hypothetical protein